MRDTSRTELPVVPELSTITAETSPGEVAFGDVDTGEEVTWAEFDARSVRAANAVRDHAGQGDRVAFLCDGSVEHTVLWNGALKAGCVVSNLHTRGAPDTIRYCLDELAPQILVFDERFADLYREHLAGAAAGVEVVVIGSGDGDADSAGDVDGDDGEVTDLDGATSAAAFTADRSTTPPDVSIGEDDLAAIMWTSGTTGKPKGWCFTNRGLVQRGQKMLSTGTQSAHTRRLQGLTPSFAAWYSVLMPALMGGAATYYVSEWDPERYLELIEEKGITSLTLVPTMWQEMLRLESFDEYDLSSLQTAGAAGERLTVETVKRLRERVCETVGNSYSATEAIVTFIRYDETNADRIDELGGTVGKAVPGTRVRVVEPDGAPDDEKPPGEVGELIVRTNDHPVWAWNRTEKSEDAFTDGWWYSGDLGYRDEDGYLYLEGRKDFMIMSKGIKVPPGPVEERLNAHPKVDESAVLGVTDEEFGERVTAVVASTDDSLTADELDQWCLDDDSLARHERPREYRITAEPLPKTVTGKLDRTSAKERILDAGE